MDRIKQMRIHGLAHDVLQDIGEKEKDIEQLKENQIVYKKSGGTDLNFYPRAIFKKEIHINSLWNRYKRVMEL